MSEMTSGIDWDDAFDNTGYTPGSDQFGPKWLAAAEEARKAFETDGRAKLGVAYGNDPREAMDIFVPERAAKGTVVFVHGGYWHLLDRSYWSHFAKGWLDNGWSVAMPSYPLAPAARISAITRSIAAAISKVADEMVGPLRLAGHSAGGHLVSRMTCAGVLPEGVAARLERVVSISGVHHLNPVLMTKMNDTLGLTLEEARAESPVNLDPLPQVPVTFWTGADERPEFLRQTRMAAERWSLKGANVDTFYDAGHNHFTVIEALEDPDGAITKEVLR